MSFLRECSGEVDCCDGCHATFCLTCIDLYHSNTLESSVDRDSGVVQEGLIDLKAIVDESKAHIVVADRWR